ncbi:MAG: ANTAR domain-containing response regulator [Clostridiaceae bacterium]
MNQYKIVVADSGENDRQYLTDMLTRNGYIVYKAKDAASTLRITRSVMPSLVLMDVNLMGMNAYDTAMIIEEDNISSVLFITGSLNKNLYDRLEKMNIYAYLTKPVNSSQIKQVVEFSIRNSIKIRKLKDKVKKLENNLEARKKIERAKGIISSRLKISEEEAYKFLRKKSMDLCLPMEIVANKILKDYGEK